MNTSQIKIHPQSKILNRELTIFITVTILAGLATSMFDSIFNNFLDANFALSGFQRSFLEFPREMPGVMVVFVSSALWFFCSRRLGGVSFLLMALGAILIGYISKSYTIMVFWLLFYNMGSHLFLPISNVIGMELAEDGHTGKRLGQLNAFRNAATIAGSFFVFLAFKYLNFSFTHTFVVITILLIFAAVLMFRMPSQTVKRPKTFFKLHKEYRLFYILAVLYGSRKQLFITFAPWVLVTIFNQPTQTLATLLTIGGIIGILFQPLLGWAIDHLGERFVLMAEAFLLIFVCLGFAFGKTLFGEHTAFIIACICYLLDQMLISVNMARAMYMQKIAIKQEHIRPALNAGVSIDHVFSIGIALLGGLIWNQFGYQYVFYMGMFIAALNFIAALRIKIPMVQEIQG